MNEKIVLYSPAKLNIYLYIEGINKEGYHLLNSLMVPINIFDKITMEKQDSGISIQGSSNDNIPWDKSNLAYKAVEIFREYTGFDIRIKINIKKRIPTGGGLGGGSGNAAAVLEGLNILTGNRYNIKTLHKLASKIGADVPFFLYHRPLIAKNIGDVFYKSGKLPSKWYIVWCPDEKCNTGEIYKKYDNLTKLSETNKISQKNNPVFGHNDLEIAVLEKCKSSVEKINVFRNIISGNFYGLSGSGSCWFANYDTKTRRDRDYDKLNEVFNGNLIKTESIV